MEPEGPYVGIDVSKDQLDIAVRPAGDTWSMPNDASGITEVVQQLAQLHKTAGIGGHGRAPDASGRCSGWRWVAPGHGQSSPGSRLRQGYR